MEEEQKKSGWRLSHLFFGVAIAAASPAYLFYDNYHDYMIDVEDMQAAAYDVNVLKSWDVENRKGDNYDFYTLSKDFVFYASTCTKDYAKVDLTGKINLTGDFFIFHSLTLPEEYRQEYVKKAFRFHAELFHDEDDYYFDFDRVFETATEAQLVRADLEKVITAVIQQNDHEDQSEKTTLLEWAVNITKTDNDRYSDCIATKYAIEPVGP